MTTSFSDYIAAHFPALAPGVHEATSGEACGLEAYHAWRGEPWSDTPDTIWDFRPLNDANWSSAAVRTQHLVPVIAAYADCTAWPLARQQAVIQRVVLLTVQRVVATLPGLPTAVRQACIACTTLVEAGTAASAAAEAARATGIAASAAARAAWDAARAAAWAADEAAAAIEVAVCAARAAAWAAEADDILLITMCRLLCEAAEDDALAQEPTP